MKITATEVLVLGDPQPLEYPEAGIAELAFVRIHTDEGIAEVSLPVVHGAVALPTAPGIGVDLPADLIAHFRVG